MMEMRERQTTASINRYISGHYTCHPRTVRNLLIWIIVFADHFIASFENRPETKLFIISAGFRFFHLKLLNLGALLLTF